MGLGASLHRGRPSRAVEPPWGRTCAVVDPSAKSKPAEAWFQDEARVGQKGSLIPRFIEMNLGINGLYRPSSTILEHSIGNRLTRGQGLITSRCSTVRAMARGVMAANMRGRL